MNGAADERAAVVALLREVGLDAPGVAHRIDEDRTARFMLAEQLGAGAGGSLLPEDPAPRMETARRDLERWERDRIRAVTVLDEAYPEALRTVHDRPPLLFVAGDAELARRPGGIAVVGSRNASAAGLSLAGEFARAFADAGHPVVSGLAAGIDAAAHRAALVAGGRSIAVVGTGLDRSYPSSSARLQRELSDGHAVLSPFWPATGPSADTFRRRNGVMSGLSLVTVIVEASVRSGTRVQARLALAHGRPVFLLRGLTGQLWARELAARPGVRVVDEPGDVLAALDQTTGPLTGPPE